MNDVVVRLKSDLSGLQTLKKGVQDALKDIGSGAARDIGAQINRAVQGLSSGFSQVLNDGGALTDLSARTGIAIDRLVVLRQAFQNAGVSGDGIGPAIGRLQKALGGINEDGKATAGAFAALGLTVSGLAAMKPDEAFRRTGEAIAALPSPAARAEAAMAVFGRSGAELLAIFGDGGAFANAERQAGGLGDAMSRNAAAFDRIGDAVGVAKTKMAEFSAGALQAFSGAGKLAEGVDGIGLGPLGATLGGTAKASANLGTAFSAAGLAAVALKGQVTALWAAMAANPIVAVVSALAALGVASVGAYTKAVEDAVAKTDRLTKKQMEVKGIRPDQIGSRGEQGEALRRLEELRAGETDGAILGMIDRKARAIALLGEENFRAAAAAREAAAAEKQQVEAMEAAAKKADELRAAAEKRIAGDAYDAAGDLAKRRLLEADRDKIAGKYGGETDAGNLLRRSGLSPDPGAAGEMAADAERLSEIKRKLAALDEKGADAYRKRNEAVAEYDAGLRMLQAELDGNRQRIDQLKDEASLREKIAKLKDAGLGDATAKERAEEGVRRERAKRDADRAREQSEIMASLEAREIGDAQKRAVAEAATNAAKRSRDLQSRLGMDAAQANDIAAREAALGFRADGKGAGAVSSLAEIGGGGGVELVDRAREQVEALNSIREFLSRMVDHGIPARLD
jgi:hypothetical protein